MTKKKKIIKKIRSLISLPCYLNHLKKRKKKKRKQIITLTFILVFVFFHNFFFLESGGGEGSGEIDHPNGQNISSICFNF
jgi:hypothetical protein